MCAKYVTALFNSYSANVGNDKDVVSNTSREHNSFDDQKQRFTDKTYPVSTVSREIKVETPYLRFA